MSATQPCPACGLAPSGHVETWLLYSSDLAALALVPLGRSPFIRFFSGIGRAGLSLLARGLLALAEALGMVRMSDDIRDARTGRSRIIWEEAQRRGIPMRQIRPFGKQSEMYEAVVRGRRHVFQSVPFPPERETEVLHIDDKVAFKELLAKHGLPSAKSYSATSEAGALAALRKLGTVCVKPRLGSNGRHTYPHVKTEEDLKQAFKSATEVCYAASVEEHLEGNLCRATCVDGRLIGFLESFYPSVEGDGVSTVAELIRAKNAVKQEGVDDIALSDVHRGYIGRRGYAEASVLPAGVVLPLVYWAGRAFGGGNKEHGRNIHPSFIPAIERAAALTELPVVGFDIIIPDPLAPADEQRWGFIEANSLPWVDLHSTPLSGTPVNLAPAIWDMWEAPATRSR